MKIGDLINACGENIKFQNLDQCVIDLNYSAKSGTTIKFGTDQKLDLQGTKDLGFVVWLPRDAVSSALAALTTQPVPVDASAAKGEVQERAYNLLVEGVEGFDGLSAAKKTDIHRVLCAALQPIPAPDSGSLSPASGWRGIETAPKDGTEILIYRDGWQEAPRAKWGDHDGEDENDKPTVFGGWFLASEWHTYGCEDGFLGWNEDIADGVMPTVWSPLPPANSKEPG